LESNPQNPYISLLVRASAGSGKTFQLSRRFLALVTAGVSPQRILTVTFSRKAAAEMKSRIIADAIAYGSSAPQFADFYEQISKWRETALAQGMSPPPLTHPETVSSMIVQNTQSLAISTIDSVMIDLCQRFPSESALEFQNGDEASSLRAPWTIADQLTLSELQVKAWNDTIYELGMSIPREKQTEFFQNLLLATPEQKFGTAWSRLRTLINSETFIWLCKNTRGSSEIYYDTESQAIQSEQDLFLTIGAELSAVISQISNEDKKKLALVALESHSIQGLIAAKILKKDASFHGTTISKKIRDALPREISSAESALNSYASSQMLSQLNSHAKILWLFYEKWQAKFLHEKSLRGLGTFTDALKGTHHIFHHNHPGARWLIQMRSKHLLLDEFQDTSRLQWDVFRELSQDLMAGQTQDPNELPGTVFIVGDAKQSIFGFREAAPEIIDTAANDLNTLGLVETDMTKSWRTSRLILDLVNKTFVKDANLPNFPLHAPASDAKGDIIPNVSSIHILPLAVDAQEQDEGGDSDLEQSNYISLEAQQIADHIHRCLNHEIETPIWQAKRNNFRRPKPGDFAILYPNSTHAHAFEDALRRLGIPALREEQRGFFDRQEIQDSVALLRWTAFSSDLLSLCAVLKSPLCNISDALIQESLSEFKGDKIHHRSSEEFLNLVLETCPDDCKNSVLALRELQKSSRDMFGSYLQFLKSVDAVTCYLETYDHVDGPLACANILKFSDLLRDAQAAGATSYKQCLDHIKKRSEEDDLGNAVSSSDAVHLMTVHKSKGLEFPVVILTDTASDWYRSESNWLRVPEVNRGGLLYIGTSAERYVTNVQIEDALSQHERLQRAEKSRLLYVAVTRAKQHLVVSGRFKPSKSAPFVDQESYFARLFSAAADRPLTNESQPFRVVAGLDLKHDLEPPNAPMLEEESLRSDIKINFRSSGQELLGLSILASLEQKDHPDRPANPKKSIEPCIPPHLQSKTFGTAVHLCLESIIRSGEPLDPLPLMSSLLENQVDALSYSRDVLTEISAAAIAHALDVSKSPPWQELFKDVDRFFSEPPWGVIDKDKRNFFTLQPDLVAEKTNGEWWIVDYKTSAHVQRHDMVSEHSYALQLRGYKASLQELVPQANVRTFIFLTRQQDLVELT
jgi:ATP-dependent helicase/nuclease subunit A